MDKHPRFLADVTGDGKADIVGFGDAGVYVALQQRRRHVCARRSSSSRTSGSISGWRVDQHPRFVVDLTGDGKADIIGFGDAGVYVALSNGDGTFTFTPVPVINDFGFDAGGWRVDRHPRLLGGPHRRRPRGHRGLRQRRRVCRAEQRRRHVRARQQLVIEDFGFDQGWRVDKHPRFLADVTGDGRADIVGFGDAGVYVARSTGNGTFEFTPVPVMDDFGFDQGWRVEKHPRFLATSPVKAGPTSSGSATPGCMWPAATATARSPSSRYRRLPTSVSTRAGGSTGTRGSSPTSRGTGGRHRRFR